MAVLANEVIGGERLVEEIASRVREHGVSEVMIVSPAAVSSRLALAFGDVDEGIEEADQRLHASVDALRRRGIEASGEVGEADPALALHDALAKFPAEEVVVVTHPGERATWLEEHVLDRVKAQLTVPITHIEVEPTSAEPVVKHVEDVPPERERTAAEHARKEFETDYLPPLSVRDRVALALGPLGVLALWLMAANCQGDIFHDYAPHDAACIALFTIATLATVVVAIHVPFLLLLRSGNERGGLASFMGKTILYGMPVALVAGFVLMIAA